MTAENRNTSGHFTKFPAMAVVLAFDLRGPKIELPNVTNDTNTALLC